MSNKENFKYLGDDFYEVRTQAGFKRALKHSGMDDYDDLDGYPKSYPCIVVLTAGYNGGLVAQVRVKHFNALKNIVCE